MIDQLLTLGFKGKKNGLYYLVDLIDDLLVCQCIATESITYANGKKIDCICLMFEYAQDGKLSKLQINKSFTNFESIVKCIEDFKKFHTEYL